MTDTPRSTPSLADLDGRSRAIFREIVQAYLDTGEPVGSRTLSQKDGVALSPASIRNTMADLAALGLLSAPHQSAGRMPTHAGLRLFVDGLLQVGDLGAEERKSIETRVAGTSRNINDLLSEASSVLGGLAGGAGLVLAPTREAALKHVEFVPMSATEALAILVFADGSVENRLMTAPDGLPPAALMEAGNYLSARLKGRSLTEASAAIRAEIAERRAQLDEAASALVEKGLADWSGGEARSLIVRGRARLLESVEATQDLERIRMLFDDLERKEDLIALLEKAGSGQGVRLFIGAENPLFSLSGSSVIVSPYMNEEKRIVGALGVIGPTRLNYARVIPLVDYTARVVGRLLDGAKT
ncbi:heat-inducible transcriptional repressor HrcA [Hyphobacterium marinum]|uniref:Heat-inducible transcription repressor HrcA n=1 Tax=Hyphobacterium marinum TaxID=3116574 RepID=A0ABU7LV93_9PROT|nr:heat-inducible transcriptional repressor HrcA [Hyphobacterium sp. Y6023]MEE2565411.1 heat-inducible transcriptional repressor HrcA [Hyphobacterium sp. Y6023]